MNDWRRRGFVRWLPVVVLSVLAWRSLNSESDSAPGFDSAVFMSMALHSAAGFVPYKDIWDHKPPVVYALDRLAMRVGGPSVNAVRGLERVFAVAGTLALFAVMVLAFGNVWIAWSGAILYLFHFYWPFVFERGN